MRFKLDPLFHGSDLAGLMAIFRRWLTTCTGWLGLIPLCKVYKSQCGEA
jgi:hypothetical protein